MISSVYTLTGNLIIDARSERGRDDYDRRVQRRGWVGGREGKVKKNKVGSSAKCNINIEQRNEE